jgi:hypothetical protein
MCVALAASASRALLQKNVAFNIKYYGKQGVGTAGSMSTMTPKPLSGTSNAAGAAVGAVIGILIGCLCLAVISTVLVVLVVQLKRRSKKTVKLGENSIPLQDISELVIYPPHPEVVIEPTTIELEEQPSPLLVEPEAVTSVVQETPKEEASAPIEPEPVVEESEPEQEPIAPSEQVTLNIESDLQLDDEGKKVLGEMKDIITDIRAKVANITNKNISELQAYATPPPVVFSVLRASLIVLGYDADELQKWGTCKKSLKDGFLRKVGQFDPTDRSHSNKAFKIAQEEIKELDYDTCLKKGSLPTAILVEWLQGVLKIRSMAVLLRNSQQKE